MKMKFSELLGSLIVWMTIILLSMLLFANLSCRSVYTETRKVKVDRAHEVEVIMLLRMIKKKVVIIDGQKRLVNKDGSLYMKGLDWDYRNKRYIEYHVRPSSSNDMFKEF